MQKIILLSILFLGFFSLSPKIKANDGVFFGQGSQLVPLKQTDIKMLSENIVIQQDQKGRGYHFQAQFKFKNPTDKIIPVTIGFPEWECQGDCDPKNKWTLSHFLTWVRGESVKTKIKEGVSNVHFKNNARVHSFVVTFQPQEQLEIKHKYSMKASGSVEGQEIHYLTRSGALWNGPIAQAVFTVYLNRFPQNFAFPSSYNLKTYQRVAHGSSKGLKAVFEQKNWVPQEDLYIHYNMTNYNVFMPKDCPFPGRKADQSTKEHVASLTKADRDFCRNAIYATYGYPFKTPKWNQIFYKASQKIRSSMPFLSAGDSESQQNWTIRFMEKDLQFKPSVISSEDQSLIQALK